MEYFTSVFRRIKRLVRLLIILSSDNPKIELGEVTLDFRAGNLVIKVPNNLDVDFDYCFMKCSEEVKREAAAMSEIQRDANEHISARCE